MKRWPEWVLLVAGASLVTTGAWSIARYQAFQSHPHWFETPISRAQRPPNGRCASVRAVEACRDSSGDLGGIVGRLDIPRLKLSVLVVEGDDEASLSLAAGHLPGTAAFGAVGNAVIAGHRDMTFRPLRKIKRGDTIQIQTEQTKPAATYKYVVEDTRIVQPDDVSVLGSAKDERLLTLITCYPFHYVGDAPQRYVVRARMAGI